MKTWKKYAAGLAFLTGLAPGAWAQTPLPAVPAARPVTLWSFLGCDPESKAACKEALCKLPIGQLMSNGLRPINALTGGILGSCCPGPEDALRDALKKLEENPNSAEGVAASIKKSEAEAKARRAAVRYLGTVDCNWYPEARDALVESLRTDPNECVRLEAAWALARGCCCTKETVLALTRTVKGVAEGGPAENSDRVKDAALEALNNCLTCNPDLAPKPKPAPKPEQLDKPKVAPGEQPKGEQPKTASNDAEKKSARLRRMGKIELAAFYEEVESRSAKEVLDEARQLLAETKNRVVVSTNARYERSVSGLFTHAVMATDAGQRRYTEMHPELAGLTSSAPPTASSVQVVKTAPLVPVAQPTQMVQQPLPLPKQPMAISQPMPVVQKPVQSSSAMPQISTKTVVVEKPGYAKATTVESVIVNKPVQARPSVVSQPVVGQPTVTTQPVKTVAAPTQSIKQTSLQQASSSATNPLYLKEWLGVLRNGTSAEVREYAVTNLAGYDVRAYPEVVTSLCQAAQKDTVPSVRVACVRSLGRMKAQQGTIKDTLKMLVQSDRDATVRSEAYQALTRMTSAQ